MIDPTTLLTSNQPPLIDMSARKPLVSVNGHWKFDQPMGIGKASGFIYIVRDNYLSRFYMGKKFYKGNGKLNRGQESDWKTYLSSSNLLKQLMGERPKEEFELICIEEYCMRGAVSYAETWSLCHVEAPTTKTWYNTRIEEISWNVTEPITKRHKERLNRVITMQPFENE